MSMKSSSLFITDGLMDIVFRSLNFVAIGWLLLVIAPFFPKFKHAYIIVDCIVLLYSVVYLWLMVPIVASILDRGETVDFSSLEAVHSLFQNRDVMLAGWTHYVAFDLFVASRIIIDAANIGFPHVIACLCLPVLLMAGPVGVVLYAVLRAIYVLKRKYYKNKITILSAMYILVVFLCIMMASWIFLFPATMFMTENCKVCPSETIVTSKAREALISSAVPMTLTTKYIGYTGIQYLHQLPCGLWVLLLPFQLHPYIRQRYPTLHKFLGYLLLISSMTLIIGVFLIHKYNLGYIQNDYPMLIPKLLSEQGKDIASEFGLFGTIARMVLPFDWLILLFISIWFVATILMAIRAARQKLFRQHRAWIYRHTASGLWVAVMRLMVIFGMFADKSREMGKFTNFTCGIIFSCIITAMFAETAVYLEFQQEKTNTSSSTSKIGANFRQKERVSFCGCFEIEI